MTNDETKLPKLAPNRKEDDAAEMSWVVFLGLAVGAAFSAAIYFLCR